MYCLCMILGGPKNNTLSPEASGTCSGTLRSVESSPSAMFRMPSRAPEQIDWTPDESSASCEECQTLFSLVRRHFIVSLVLAEPMSLLLLPAGATKRQPAGCFYSVAKNQHFAPSGKTLNWIKNG